jgi:hypothetical protein
MFRLIEPSVHSVSAYALTECNSTKVLACRWLSEPKHVAEFLIFNIDHQYMLCH